MDGGVIERTRVALGQFQAHAPEHISAEPLADRNRCRGVMYSLHFPDVVIYFSRCVNFRTHPMAANFELKTFPVSDEGASLQDLIGRSIRAERARLGITQDQLAAAVGVSRPTIVAAETGQNVGSHTLLSLLSYLNMKVSIQPLAHGSFARHEVGPKPVSVRQAPGKLALQRRRPLLKDLVIAERDRQSRLAAASREENGAPRRTSRIRS
jgi:transcriptional regulator with XRE-family HTH domain